MWKHQEVNVFAYVNIVYFYRNEFIMNNNDKEFLAVLLELKNLMAQKGITVYRIAQITGISNATLHRNLDAEFEMSLHTYMQICKAIDIHPDQPFKNIQS